MKEHYFSLSNEMKSNLTLIVLQHTDLPLPNFSARKVIYRNFNRDLHASNMLQKFYHICSLQSVFMTFQSVIHNT